MATNNIPQLQLLLILVANIKKVIHPTFLAFTIASPRSQLPYLETSDISSGHHLHMTDAPRPSDNTLVSVTIILEITITKKLFLHKGDLIN